LDDVLIFGRRSRDLSTFRIVTWLAPNHLGLSTTILLATVQTLANVLEYAVASHHRYMTAAET
jgi:hypothetical protein